jgi:hypothetical protein
MAFFSWFQRPQVPPTLTRRQPRHRLQLELLEQRTLPSTFEVLNLNDHGPNSLRAAVAAANTHPGPDTITFAPSLHGTIRLTGGELLVTDSVTIDGPGANQLAVSGNNASRVFELAGPNATIRGLSITHGSALDEAGGILNDGGNLTLFGDVLSQNVAYEGASDVNGAQGGALLSLGGTLTMTDCIVAGNQAVGGAGAAASGQAYGGGLLLAAGSATIKDSTFTGNVAAGGANSSFGASAGGAIDTGGPSYTDSVPLTITDCTFTNNQATASANAPSNASTGGAISTGAGAVSIAGSTFDHNQAVGGDGGAFEFAGEAEGGAIANYCPLTISNSTFTYNTARAGNGGSDPGFVDADPSVDIAYGGAIFNLYGPDTGFLDSSLNITCSRFSNNTAIGGNNSSATGTDIVEAGSAEGGAIGMEIGVAATISNTIFDHNQAIGGSGNSASGPVIDVGTGFGGAILTGWGGEALGATTLTVSDSTFIQNSAVGGNNNTGTASVAGFVGAGVGAGIANYLGGTANISDSTLALGLASGGHGNTASGTDVFAGLGAGGGIFNAVGNYNSSGYGQFNASVVTVSNCVVALNQAQGGGSGAGLGGGVYNDGSSSLALTGSLVFLNQANGTTGLGGGIYTVGAFTHDALTVIQLNHASTGGNNVGP